jgi:hypothetical protein
LIDERDTEEEIPKRTGTDKFEPNWKVVIEELEKYHIKDEQAPLEKLKLHLKNPRHHAASLIAKPEESMKHFGRISQMIVDEVLSGNARLKAEFFEVSW